MSRPGNRPLIVLLTALTSTGPVAMSIYLPSLPAMAAALDAETGVAQLTLTSFLVGFAVAHLAYGPASDRFGRRWVLLGGLFLYVGASAICALAPTIEALIVARFFQAVGACAGPVIARAIVRDVFEAGEVARVMAWMGTAMAIAPAIAPVLGGYLEVSFGWHANFVATALYGLAIIAWLWRALPETNLARRVHVRVFEGIRLDYAALLRTREFVVYATLVGLGFAALYAFQAAAPIIVIELLGYGPDVFGLLSLIGVGSYAVGSVTAGTLALRVGHGRMLWVGVVVATAGGWIMAAFALAGVLTLATLFGPLIFYGLGMGLFLPYAMAAAISPHPEMAGTASALLGFFQTALGAAGSIAVAALPSGSQVPMTLVMAGALLAAVLTLAGLRRSRARAARPETAD